MLGERALEKRRVLKEVMKVKSHNGIIVLRGYMPQSPTMQVRVQREGRPLEARNLNDTIPCRAAGTGELSFSPAIPHWASQGSDVNAQT